MLLEHFPSNVCRNKILPHLINAYEYGEAGAAVLTPLLKVRFCILWKKPTLRLPSFVESF